MSSALWLARMIHDDLTIAGVNAWHNWWLNSSFGEEEMSFRNDGLVQAGVVTRRAHVMGNFSRFVRPGSVRLGTPNKAMAGVFATAFRSADSSQFVLVAVNAGSSALGRRFELGGAELGEVTPWVTSDTDALSAKAPIPGGSSFSYELPARSVTTFVAAVNL